MHKVISLIQRIGFGLVLLGLLFQYQNWSGASYILITGCVLAASVIITELFLAISKSSEVKFSAHIIVDRLTKLLLLSSIAVLLTNWKFKLIFLFGAMAIMMVWNIIYLLFPNILDKDKSDRASILDAPED